MKFHLLKEGDRFIYRGEVYFKSTPMVAVNEVSGNTRLIPRSAILQLMDNVSPGNTSNPGLDNDTQQILRLSTREFVNGLGNIVNLTENDKLAIEKLYEDVTTRFIKNMLPIES